MTNSKVCELINENNFKSVLTNELYALIDEELAKGDEMDCELIDELVLAIESLEQAEDENKGIIFPVIFGDVSGFSKRVINKVNNRNRLMQLTAWAAVIAILCSGTNELLLRSENTTLVNELSKMVQKVSQFLTDTLNSNEEEATTLPSVEESTTAPSKEIIELNIDKPTATKSEIVSIGLITYSNFKTSYLWNENLDLSGLKVVAVYSDDTEKTISVSDCEISGFNSLKLGEQLVTVKYKGFSAYFKVTVSRTEQNDEASRIITNIECNMTDKDVIVPKGTQNPAVAKNVKYRYVYSDGTFSSWTSCEDATLVSDYDSELLDEAQALTYRAPNGMTFTLNVVVYDNAVSEEKTVTKLEIQKIPQAMRYYANNYDQHYMYVDEECDFSQFTFKVYYSDRTSKIKTLADGDIKAFGTMSTERPSSYSGYTITFAYGDITTTFKYEVIIKPEIHTYTFNESIWQTYYIHDAPEEYNAKNIVKAKMNDSNKEVYLDVELKGYDPNKTGYIELEVYYEGQYLGDYIGGYIYGDSGFAVIERPITQRLASEGFSFTPYVTVAKCVGNGKFETYGDLGLYPSYAPNQGFESSTSGELKAMGITRYGAYQCISSATVYYKVSADEYITEFGTHEAKVYLYDVLTIDNGWSYERVGIAEDLSYKITIKENPSYYQVEAPKNLKINIQDIYSEFYDKLHVYAHYSDGRKEEVFDYDIIRYLPSRPTTSACLPIHITYPNEKGSTYVNVYVYSEGYEDSFYITARDYFRETYDNFYAVGIERPSMLVNFASAEQSQIQQFSIYPNDNINPEAIEIQGWDTSTPGEKTATIIYHSPVGDLKTTYKYVVIPKYLEESCSIVFNDENYAYDCRYGLIDGTYKVYHTDKVGRIWEISDYTVTYPTNVTGYGVPTISYWHPHPLANADSSNPRQEKFTPNMKIVGACENLQIEKLSNGDIKISLDCLYQPENGTMLFSFGYPAEKGQYGVKIKYIESATPEVIITRDMLQPDINTAFFYIRAYIVDDETGEKFGTYSERIDSFPLN